MRISYKKKGQRGLLHDELDEEIRTITIKVGEEEYDIRENYDETGGIRVTTNGSMVIRPSSGNQAIITDVG